MKKYKFMPPLKYQEKIRDCNLEGFSERERIAYRWVSENISDQNNFIPRALHRMPTHCTDWALSFFVTAEQAKTRLNTLCNGRPLIYKALGTHIGKGILEHQDGISDNENELGHFNHFEYEGIDLTPKFQIVEKVT